MNLSNCTSPSFIDFGTASNLTQTLNSDVTFDNNSGFSSIGFRLVIPTAGTVTFEGTFDGSNWISVTMRNIESDGYTQVSSATGNYIGSIAALRKFRIRVSTGGNAAGSVIGRASMQMCTLEGIENTAGPHAVGYKAVRKNFSYSTAQTGVALWTPASGKKFVVTDITFNLSLLAGTVTFFDGTDSSANWLYKAPFETPPLNGSFRITYSFKIPFVSSTADNVLKLTTSANIGMDGAVYGYEI